MKKIIIKDLVMDVPIIQGGMGVGISLGNLAGHVALNGGMGVISTAHPGYREPDFETNNIQANINGLKKEIAKAKEIAKGKGIIAINAMVALTDYKIYVQAALEAGIQAIISGAGLPLNLPELVEGYDVKIAPIVSSGKALRVIARNWQRKYNRLPDFVVIEGGQAGGHLGFSKEEALNDSYPTLSEIFKEVKQEVVKLEDDNNKIPVFVAGGVYTNQDIKDCLDMGADGVQMATRFICTHECDADIKYKEAFIAASKEDVEIVVSPVGMPGRAIKTKLTEQLKQGRIPVKRCYNCLVPCNVKDAPYCISTALVNAVKGNLDEGLVFSGKKGYLNNEIVSVKDLIEELVKE